MKTIKVFDNSIGKDKRGLIWTSWSDNHKINRKFNHDKFSLSKKNVLRGLHYDTKSWKLISCVFGKFFFVVVNFNKKSKSYLKVKTWTLDHRVNKSILIPPYHANGHLCLSDHCVFHYKMSYQGRYPDVKDQVSIKWNDKRLKVKWPISKKKLILSKRDI